MEFEHLIADCQEDLKQVEAQILSHLATDIPLLNQVGRHILLSGGKRMRPVVSILAARMFGATGQRVHQAAASVEFLHTATLPHDDVVDNTDQRRQKETARLLFGNPASVLVGDYLLAISFRTFTQLGDLVMLDTISHTTSLMAKGEILQLIRRFDTASEADYLAIIIYKTASLFAASAKIGGCCGHATSEQCEALYQYGHHLGIAFQIVDDALDYTPQRERIGKPQGTDFKERKVTLPLSRLVNLAQGAEKDRLLALLAQEEITDAHVGEVAEMMMRHKVLEYTLDEATRYVTTAKSHLGALPDTPERSRLAALADFVVQRDY